MREKRIIDEREQCMPKDLDYGIGMKYYKCLKVMLVLGAILQLGSSITYFNGDVYLKQGLNPTLMYSDFPNLKILDMIYGIVIIAFAAFQLYVRNQLAWKTKRVPNLIVVFSAVCFVPNMIYNIAVVIIKGYNISIIFSLVVPILIWSSIYAYITYVYFKKRKFMFVN